MRGGERSTRAGDGEKHARGARATTTDTVTSVRDAGARRRRRRRELGDGGRTHLLRGRGFPRPCRRPKPGTWSPCRRASTTPRPWWRSTEAERLNEHYEDDRARIARASTPHATRGKRRVPIPAGAPVRSRSTGASPSPPGRAFALREPRAETGSELLGTGPIWLARRRGVASVVRATLPVPHTRVFDGKNNEKQHGAPPGEPTSSRATAHSRGAASRPHEGAPSLALSGPREGARFSIPPSPRARSRTRARGMLARRPRKETHRFPDLSHADAPPASAGTRVLASRGSNQSTMRQLKMYSDARVVGAKVRLYSPPPRGATSPSRASFAHPPSRLGGGLNLPPPQPSPAPSSSGETFWNSNRNTEVKRLLRPGVADGPAQLAANLSCAGAVAINLQPLAGEEMAVLAEGLKRAENMTAIASRARPGAAASPSPRSRARARARASSRPSARRSSTAWTRSSRVPASARASASRWPRTSARRTPSPRLRSTPTSAPPPSSTSDARSRAARA